MGWEKAYEEYLKLREPLSRQIYSTVTVTSHGMSLTRMGSDDNDDATQLIADFGCGTSVDNTTAHYTACLLSDVGVFNDPLALRAMLPHCESLVATRTKATEAFTVTLTLRPDERVKA